MDDDGVLRRWRGRRRVTALVAVAAALIVAAFAGAYGAHGMAAASGDGMTGASTTGASTTGAPTTGAPTTGASVAGATVTATKLGGQGARPCDIYAAGGTPCAAAYSTTRALYRYYDGPLYQVTRESDGASADIRVTRPGGYADAAFQDTFCAGTICTISRLFDQSPYHNDLGVEPIGGNGQPDVGAIANALPVIVDGHQVYGLNVQAGVGYRNDVTNGVPVGGQPQGAYMVTSGTHVDGSCCFDFGNAETSNTDRGNGHMDAINFGTECWFTPCTGSGPWVQADMENGLFMGGNGSDPANVGNSSAFVTAMLKNNGTTTYAIKDANARSGPLKTEYSGPLPDIGGYTPMSQEGSVLLGTGGDDSNGSDGSFFEGVLTAGYPSDATDDAIQANIVAAGYQRVPSSFPVVGASYVITNVNSAKAVQPDSCGTANGTGMELYTTGGTNCQQWTFSSAGHGHYVITNEASGKVLDSVDCGIFDGTLTDLWSPLGNTCQEWDVTPDGTHVTISNVGNGMVLDAEDCETANGTVVRQWAQLDNACQEWDITG